MKLLFSELVEINGLQSLCEIFSKLTGFATAILDMEGNVLAATGWREICAEFHRKNPAAAKACHESDTILGELPSPGAKYNVYRCKNGLIDVSVPIMVENVQIGRLYTGQFLFDPPDVEFFRHQTAEYGFDETSYLEAVQKVPIVTEEQVGQVMEFLCRLAEMIGRMGLSNQRLREANAELRVHRQELERLVEERTTELSAKNDRLRREIDERKRAEEELQRANDLLHAIIEAAPAAIIGLDLDGNVQSVWNPAAEKMLGWSADEVMGRPLPSVPVESMEEFSRFREWIRSGKNLNGVEVRRQRRDGTPIDYSIYASPLHDVGGRITGYVAVLLDISEHRRAEEALRQANLVVENSPVVLFRWKAAEGWPVELVSRNVTQFGYKPEELLSGSITFSAMVHPQDLERVVAEVREYSASGCENFEQEYRIVTGDEDVRWIYDRTVIERDRDGCITHYQGIVIDITERKRAEEKIQAALAEKEVLLKEVHHRVKNNLQIISTLLELQSEYIPDDNLRKFFSESQDRIRSMALVHEKLYQTMDLARINFAGYIESLTSHLFRSYVTDPEQISLSVESGNVTLGIDEAIPYGLIINELVSNSLKHAFPEGRKGNISVRFQAEDQGLITLTVADDGVGLPPGMDFRDTESMGLQLVNMLTKQLRGEISLLNEEGAAFTIRLKS